MNYQRYSLLHLPQTYNPLTLYDFYSHITFKYTEKEYRQAVHDLSVYEVPEGLSYDEFVVTLTEAFFSHPTIGALAGEIRAEEEFYYGRVRGWIKRHCTDLPLRNRKALHQTTLTLYKWFEVLGADQFLIDRPNLGQRIRAVT